MPSETRPYYVAVRRIVDHGTIVEVVLSKGRVYFDHRPFRWMVEARGGLKNVINQRCRVIDEDGCESILFEDEEEGGE